MAVCRTAVHLEIRERNQYRRPSKSAPEAGIVFPNDVADVLRRVIADAEPADGEHLATILRHHQIVLARWNGRNENPVGFIDTGLLTSAIAQNVVYWSYIHALAAAAFGYARGGPSISKKMTEHSVLSLLRFEHLDHDHASGAPEPDWGTCISDATQLYLRAHKSGNWLLP